MSYIKILLYFIAGLFIVGAVTCVAFFFMFGKTEALGGALMFVCFGVALGLLSIYFDQIVAPIKSGDRHAA